MVKVIFIDQNDIETTIEATVGMSVLEVAHQHDIDIEGACGGSLACATCHVIVERKFFDNLPIASEEEEDMLDLAFNLTKTSRLGCQIIINQELDGMKLYLPREEDDSL